MRNVWTIARREYSRFFSSPVGYVIAFVILFVLGLAFLGLLIFDNSAQFQGGTAETSANFVFSVFAFVMVLAVPALTMRLIAEESRTGTLELLLTAPVRDWELIVGKWLGGFLFMLTLIAVTIIYPLILNAAVSPGIDQKALISSYIGLILVSAAFLALGIGVSAFFTNQFAALFATLGLFIVLWLLLAVMAQVAPAGPFGYLDMSSHFSSMNSGTINLSDVVYYLSLIALGLFAGTQALEARRWS